MTPQGSQEFVSLLFTPRTGDSAKTLPDYRAAKPASRSPSTPAAGFRKADSQNVRDSTPRRRSLSPMGSMRKEALPPPPTDSMFGSDAAAAGTAPQGFGLLATETSPGETTNSNTAAAPPDASGSIQSPWEQQRSTTGPLDTWVTVFGFTQRDMPQVLREFQKCGDILQFGTFGEGPAVNWMHLQYSSRPAAQRALLRNGDQLSGILMVGVRPLDTHHRAAVELFLAAAAEASTSTHTPRGIAVRRIDVPKPVPARPYKLEAPAGGAGVPRPSKTAWDKVSEFVFGI